MYVIKRNGKKEPVHFDKITSRIKKLSWGLSKKIDPIKITKKVSQGIYNGVLTTQLDELAAQISASMVTIHPDYGLLASRIEVSNLHKNTKKIFSEVIKDLYNYVNPKTNDPTSLISDKIYKIIQENKKKINSAIVYDRDYNYNYFGIKTLTKSYLLKLNNKIVERPQHMLMRVSLGIHHDDIESAIETYNLMSQKWFTHASPTLFNSGTPKPQLSSCFLLTMKEDSIEGIYDTLKQCAQISKHAGGIGISIHSIRGEGSYIKGTNGISNGIIPMLRVFNNTARYVDQCGKRKGSFAIYLEPWHCDIFAFLDLRKNHGNEEQRARDLFFGLWIPDLFMQRVENDQLWSLFCPNQAKGLHEVYGDQFNKLYIKYENEKCFKRQIKARDLWKVILESQIETGTPYMLYKDACNIKSNQKNLGTIKSSNLCTEIIEYTSKDEIAVCNLASISLPKFVDIEKKTFNFQKLIEITKIITKNLNKVIKVTYYPLQEAKNSNLKHRPIGIGVQGLADVFILLRIAFDSKEAKTLNKEIFEAIYFGALTASNQIARKEGVYETYKGSPISENKLQFDLWKDEIKLNKNLFDWDTLRKNISKYGIRNSLLIAPMPTASTSQILGNNECFEPYTSNVYIRRTLAGEFICINNHLLRDLIKLGIWNSLLKDKIILSNGSVQNINEIPNEIKNIYKTVWEISQKKLIDMAIDRGHFIDQSQSLNIYMESPTIAKLTSMHFYGWKKGLKTGMYYLRTKAAVDAIKFTIDQNIKCSLDNESCLMCGS